MSKDLWKGRFESALDPKVRDFTASLELDKRLASHDVRGSIAHARMLGRQRIIPDDEAATLVRELERIAAEIDGGTFAWPADAEDVHSAVERVLTERAGAVGGKLHTGRSRNDQIALDLRLLVVELLDQLDAALLALSRALVERASDEVDTVMPGYTHLQRAQPLSLAHHLLAHVEALRRDRVRAAQARERAAVSPLGAGALAGVPYPVDPPAVGRELGLPRTFRNSVDAVADRDFVADFVYVCALAAVHASRFAEELVLWTSAEFAFAEISDQHATGSSIMPQKKNPDVAELVRGRAGRIIGDLVAILTTLKGLPLAYDGDLQEQRVPLYDASAVIPALETLALVVTGLRFDRDAMLRATERGMLTATDLADHLARQGVPFREAHEIVGRLVR
ncbi:MAG TPA: argininosuccinate lyase, partial [Candidatus Limnocylindria bacterium]|nr:argininosuccinate lyase [Candidatus Limnocylindria bacterium]